MKKYVWIALSTLALAACNSHHDEGKSTPIDSTNVNGAAPAKYEPQKPTYDTAHKNNLNDTGTKASNVHNAGTK